MLLYRDLDILVVVKDSQGRIFESMDTVPVDWTLSDTSLASLAQPKGVLSQVVHLTCCIHTCKSLKITGIWLGS